MNYLRENPRMEQDFFELNQQDRLAHIEFSFENTSELFDLHYLSKKPILCNDFIEQMKNAFRLVPPSYRLSFDIRLKNPDGYTEEELKSIFHDIFFYISDIAATVTIWEALGLLLVDSRESRIYRRNLISRFNDITFHISESH